MSGSSTHTEVASAPNMGYARLFLVSLLSLFVELLLIRWIGTVTFTTTGA